MCKLTNHNPENEQPKLLISGQKKWDAAMANLATDLAQAEIELEEVKAALRNWIPNLKKKGSWMPLLGFMEYHGMKKKWQKS